MEPTRSIALMVTGLTAGYGPVTAVRDVTLPVEERLVTAITGPSGAGKSTLVRCMNRMHELTRGAFVRGEITLEGRSILGMDPVLLRRQVGMVLPEGTLFPTMSIFQNVAAGLWMNRLAGPDEVARRVEGSLRRTGIWDEVKDRLDEPAAGLPGGREQQLSIARALVMEPRILILDEPCASLDPIAAAVVEELLLTLRKELTVVIVTHNMQQAARLSHRTAFLLGGELVEFGETDTLFTRPADKRTEDYITGRFG